MQNKYFIEITFMQIGCYRNSLEQKIAKRPFLCNGWISKVLRKQTLGFSIDNSIPQLLYLESILKKNRNKKKCLTLVLGYPTAWCS
jgi:hypothetical protein